MGFVIVTALVKFVIIELLFLLPLASVLTWMDRRQSAYLQDRVGPTRATITVLGHRFTLWGLTHVLADALKLFFKEPFVPDRADKRIFKLAPLVGFTVSLTVMALVPFGPDINTSDLPLIGPWLLRLYPEHPVIPLQVARLDAGVLMIFAISSLGIYGLTLAGWASNSRYALLGGLRAAAQAISYEVALGLTAVGVFIAFGSTELWALVGRQAQPLFGGLPAWGLWVQPLGALLFLTASIAECKRTPFDLPEGESEIIGYFVEYSSMAFGLFMLGEYVEVAVLSSVFVALFLGGWQLPWLVGQGAIHLGVTTIELSSFGLGLVGMLGFGLKVFLLSAFQLQIRWTLPRFRYDQLMHLGWKNILPLALLNIVVTAVLVWIDPGLELAAAFGFVLIAVLILVVVAGPSAPRRSMTRGRMPDAHALGMSQKSIAPEQTRHSTQS